MLGRIECIVGCIVEGIENLNVRLGAGPLDLGGQSLREEMMSSPLSGAPLLVYRCQAFAGAVTRTCCLHSQSRPTETRNRPKRAALSPKLGDRVRCGMAS